MHLAWEARFVGRPTRTADYAAARFSGRVERPYVEGAHASGKALCRQTILYALSRQRESATPPRTAGTCVRRGPYRRQTEDGP